MSSGQKPYFFYNFQPTFFPKKSVRVVNNKAEVKEKKKNGCHRLSSPAISGYVSEISTCQPPGSSLIKYLTILMTIGKMIIKILMQNVMHSYLNAGPRYIIVLQRYIKRDILMRCLSRYIK